MNGVRKYFRPAAWPKMGTLLILFILSVLLILGEWGGFSSPARARPPGGSPHHGAHLEHLVEELGLDEETRAQVDAIIDASRTEIRALRRKTREAAKHMRTLLEQEEPNEATVMKQVEVIGKLKMEGQKQRLRTMLRVRALLTPEQRAKLLERLKEMPGRGQRRPGWYGDPPRDRPGGPSAFEE